MTLADKLFEIVVEYKLEPSLTGTHFESTLKITPQSFVARLMSPLVRMATQRQVAKDVAKLKSVLEAS